MSYRAHESNARYRILKLAKSFDPRCGFKERVDTYRDFCLSMELLACCALLARADVVGFSRGLMHAAANWRVLLEYARRREPSMQVPASLNRPLLGAICCGPLPFACELADVSARELVWPEYDDEFLSALFLQEYLRSRFGQNAQPSDLEVICDRIDTYLEKQTPRTAVFRALARKSESRFWETFQAWSETSAQEVEARAEGPSAPPWLQICRYVWLEGMAVLNLAVAEGFRLPSHRRYRLIPTLALTAPTFNPSTRPLLLGQSIQEGDL